MIEIHEIEVQVGIGNPIDNNLIFNIHFTRILERISWNASFSYSQLCTIDNFITKNCDKLNHVMFPIVKLDDINQIITYINHENNINNIHLTNNTIEYERKIINNNNSNNNKNSFYNNIINKKIFKILKLLENWIHMILLRLHIMPISIKIDIFTLFCLPYGKLNELELKRFNLENVYNIDNDNIDSNNNNNDNNNNNFLSKFKLGTSFFKKNSNKIHTKTHNNNNSTNNNTKHTIISLQSLQQQEIILEQSQPPMLKITVERGRVVQRGKLEYKISIQHSRNNKIIPNYDIYRSFDKFMMLYDDIINIEGMLLFIYVYNIDNIKLK
jgi:hypothetical protein